MSLLEEDKSVLGASRSESFVPSLQITAGQRAPIAANGGMSYPVSYTHLTLPTKA